MPPAYPPERAPCIYHKQLLRKVLFFQPHSVVQEAMTASLEVAFLAGALGALTWFIMATGDGDSVNLDSFNSTAQAEAAVALMIASKFVHGILDNFQFFPSFLLLGLLTFIVNRYKRLIQTCRHRRTLLTRGRPRCLQMARIPDQLSHCSGAPSRHRRLCGYGSDQARRSGNVHTAPHNDPRPAHCPTQRPENPPLFVHYRIIGAGFSSSSTDVRHAELQLELPSANHVVSHGLRLVLARPERGARTDLSERASPDAEESKRLCVPGLTHRD